jgi:hypothetical protein
MTAMEDLDRVGKADGWGAVWASHDAVGDALAEHLDRGLGHAEGGLADSDQEDAPVLRQRQRGVAYLQNDIRQTQTADHGCNRIGGVERGPME